MTQSKLDAAVLDLCLDENVTSVVDACLDPDLFRPWFPKLESWANWFAFLKAVFGIKLSRTERRAFQKFTGRDKPPEGLCRAAWLCCGRRAGKSLILSIIAAYLAALDWTPYLSPGERASIVVIAADRKQARSIFRYVYSLLKETALADLIEGETDESITLKNRVTIEIMTASFKTVRGYTVVAALLDEQAFWASEGSNPDKEILNAIRPAMATIPTSRLLVASSPYARKGELWEAYQRHYGKPGPVIFWKAATQDMNPEIDYESEIAPRLAEDEAAARAEFFAEFRSDVESFVAREVVDACTVSGRHELMPMPGQSYVAFTDPSGGSSDAMTLSIAHKDWNDRIVVDAIRSVRPPFSPDAVVAEFAQLLRSYGISRVTGDRYAGEWPRERFRIHGIIYECSTRPKSEIYLSLLPILNSGEVELLDLPRLRQQLLGLERRTSRTGRDTIDHPPGNGAAAHDDEINSCAGAIVLAREGRAHGSGICAVAVPSSVFTGSSGWDRHPGLY